ncbi:hypothetical protein [Tsukamurella sp. TY48]|nr:hypothetical protein [Tsukamurella sp. TY48]
MLLRRRDLTLAAALHRHLLGHRIPTNGVGIVCAHRILALTT